MIERYGRESEVWIEVYMERKHTIKKVDGGRVRGIGEGYRG